MWCSGVHPTLFTLPARLFAFSLPYQGMLSVVISALLSNPAGRRVRPENRTIIRRKLPAVVMYV